MKNKGLAENPLWRDGLAQNLSVMSDFYYLLCIKTVEIARIGNAILKSFSRGCNDNEQLCNKDVIMNSGAGNKVIRIVNTCCHEDYCNDCIVRAPPYNVTLNTLLCPVCFKHSSYRCLSSGYIKCRGRETQCMNIAATLVREDNSTFKFSLMGSGCSTQDGCSAGPKMMPTSKVVDVTRLSCVPALPITH
ncbi:protein RoBo-1-like isoform X2 [Hyperolius riggenbachi]|uniref:protein RoBo-1-like isoform X2 n=1 Tax=Hyperolius riggenbachi TaxID=752182 RepID=UPI0035A34C17